jgi:plastocyanin
MLKTGGAALAGLLLPALPRAWAASETVEIHMRSRDDGAYVTFDPIGVLVQPGVKIRWVVEADVHTTTAYHPANDSHPLRIPTIAQPWASDYLVNPGDSFEVTLTAEGVYDYFCTPHEMAGMVGRIIVGRPTGPGALPFDYYAGDPTKSSWIDVPQAARERFPSIELIMSRKAVRAG